MHIEGKFFMLFRAFLCSFITGKIHEFYTQPFSKINNKKGLIFI